MLQERKEINDIYKIKTNQKINIKKIIILVLIIVVGIGVIMIAKNSIQLLNQYKVYKQYEAQLLALQKEEEEAQKRQEEEQEKIRQERIPKLTQERKN